MFRLSVTTALILAASLSACDLSSSQSAASSTSAPNVAASPATEPNQPGALLYPTRVGTISIVIPENYVALSKVDPAYFKVFAAQQQKLEVVEVFISAADLQRSKTEPTPLQDQMFQIHLFPPDAPPVDDKAWETLRLQLPAFMSGKKADEIVDRAIGPAADRFNAISGGAPKITGLDLDKIVVYHVSDRDVRWVTRGNVSVSEGGTGSQFGAVIASSIIRKGGQLFMLQSAKQVASFEQVSAVQANLDHWVSSIR